MGLPLVSLLMAMVVGQASTSEEEEAPMHDCMGLSAYNACMIALRLILG